MGFAVIRFLFFILHYITKLWELLQYIILRIFTTMRIRLPIGFLIVIWLLGLFLGYLFFHKKEIIYVPKPPLPIKKIKPDIPEYSETRIVKILSEKVPVKITRTLTKEIIKTEPAKTITVEKVKEKFPEYLELHVKQVQDITGKWCTPKNPNIVVGHAGNGIYITPIQNGWVFSGATLVLNNPDNFKERKLFVDVGVKAFYASRFYYGPYLGLQYRINKFIKFEANSTYIPYNKNFVPELKFSITF